MADNKLKNLIHGTTDHAGECTAEDIEKNKLMGILCYIFVLWLIPLFAAKDSRYARFHVNQGIILSIIDVVVYILGKVLGALIGWIPFIGWTVGVITGILGLACFAYTVLGIYNVIKGNAKELPFIGRYTIVK
ncbi:MAG: zinc ribbon domain-containing protein [Clostridiales bacterium]|nr:zinc ribbon domain-containing protein [Clostridiales bacterium]